MERKPGNIVLHLRPLPSAVPVGRRVTQLLRLALRAQQLRCVEAVEVDAGQAAAERLAVEPQPVQGEVPPCA